MRTCSSRVEARRGRAYELVELVGEGGFGRVYRARQVGPEGFGKEVAVKIADRAEGLAAERLRNEARILALVRHRAVVQVDDLVELPQGWAVVMEYVEGADLADVMEQQEALPLSVAAEVVVEVAGALACAGPLRGPGGRPLLLQHRDIKPANIRVTPQGAIKLLDFGISWAVTAPEGELDALPYGSCGYVSPERMRKEDHYSSDIFALGVVLYEMLAGEPLGPAEQAPDAHERRLEQALKQLPPGIPPAARRLLREMLAWHPDERPSAREVERRAAALARSAEPTLRDWAEARLPALQVSPRRLADASDRGGGSTWSFTPPASGVRAASGPHQDVDPGAPTQPRSHRTFRPVTRWTGRIPASWAMRLLVLVVAVALVGGLIGGTVWSTASGLTPTLTLEPGSAQEHPLQQHRPDW